MSAKLLLLLSGCFPPDSPPAPAASDSSPVEESALPAGDSQLELPAEPQDSTPGLDSDSGEPLLPEEEPLCPAVPREEAREPVSAPEGGAVFRFRSYEGEAPDWVSPLMATTLVMSEGADLVVEQRGPEVDGQRPFRERLYTVLDGDYWLGAETLETEDLSIEAWFRTRASPKWQTLFSNTEGGGFSLKLKEGMLRGLYRVEDGSGWADLEHLGPWDVSDGSWHHAVFTVERADSGYETCMWLDGQSDCLQHSVTAAPLDSNILPSVGTEPDEEDGLYTFTTPFYGELSALVVHDYAMTPEWLGDRVLRDGSVYFDTPSYHDYLSGRDGVEQRTLSSVQEHPELLEATAARYRLPFQDDRYVVQGIGSHASGEIFLSMYYTHREDDFTCQDEPYVVNSILVGFDPCTSELTRVFMLYGPDGEVNMAHVGGMAIVGDEAWTTHVTQGETWLARYPLEEATQRESVEDELREELLPSGAPWQLRASAIYAIPEPCGSAFMSYDRESQQLWMGSFSTSTGADLCTLSLPEGGEPGELLGSWSLPLDDIQGVLSLGDGRVLLSQSYGDDDSALHLWTPGESGTRRQLTLPAGLEDLTMSPEGLIWSSSESGARFMQKRFDENLLCGPNWGALYPYAFALDPESFLD